MKGLAHSTQELWCGLYDCFHSGAVGRLHSKPSMIRIGDAKYPPTRMELQSGLGKALASL